MEPIRFADILFVFLVLLITFSILWLVNRTKDKTGTTDDNSTDESSVTAAKDA